MTEPATFLGTGLADRYTIERELGAGGMATVYLAHDIKHNRRVAIKVLRSDIAQTVGADRFLREIQLAARLNHPNILALFDSGQADGSLFYVMPAVEGESLRERITRDRMLPVDEAVRIAIEVAGALDHAHRHGVVHRDIKPENILLQEGHALVADFGIGKALSAMEGEAFTQTGVSVGTPAYMSPEQAAGDSVDGRSDIYSLGCVLYEMLVGEQPFTGPTVQAVIAKRFVQTPADVAALREGVARPVARAIQRALARTPVDRYETGALFVASLGEIETAVAKNAAPERSLAVLPFVNLSADKENEYFGDGIAEDIINALTRIEGLHVAARTSAFSFKDQKDPVAAIGERLNVATVLQGSVRRSGNRLRITAQLVSVTDGYHLWSERYDRDLTDVFVVQDEIAAAIAAKLQVTFVTPAGSAAGPATTAEVEAYQLYVTGRALSIKRGAEIPRAIECFEKSIELDPTAARAYAGLGEAIRIQAQYGFAPAAEVIPYAKAALERALEIDPGSAEALTILALIAITYDLEPSAARMFMARAIAINPILPEARCLFAVWVLALVESDDDVAVEELRRAQALDPLNSICYVHGAFLFTVIGRYDDAIADAVRAVELNPTAFSAHLAETYARTWAGDVDRAMAAANRALQLSGRHPWVISMLTQLYVTRDDRVRAEAAHQELVSRSLTSHVQWLWLANSAVSLGRLDEAMDYAMRSVKVNDGFGPWFVRWPLGERFREHPRYPELRRLAGL